MTETERRRLSGSIDREIGVAVAVCALPVALTTLAFAAAAAVGVSDVGQLWSYGAYAALSVPVVAALPLVYDRERLTALLPVARPSLRQFAAAIAALFVGFGVYAAAGEINAVLGVSMSGMDFALSDRAAVAVIAIGAVIVAPIAEEVLFRGVLLGTLLDRGWHPALAGAAVVVAFALIHLPNFGLGGVVFVLGWGTLPTAMRLYFDDLSGAVVLHALNNAWAYVAVPILFG